MIDKRFTMGDERSNIKEWTMSIVDHQTKEPFSYAIYGVYSSSREDTKDELEDLCLLLNELHEENQRLTEKLNQTALELVDECISQEKAVEISEMCYNEFLDYRARHGKPMELYL